MEYKLPDTPWDDTLFDLNEINRFFEQIIHIRHWGSTETQNHLSDTIVDRFINLSRSLTIWLNRERLTTGELIIAWAHLGAVTEGVLRCFLIIYAHEYLMDEHAPKSKGKIIKLDKLHLESMRHYIEKNDLFNNSWMFIEKVQKQRNIIHVTKDDDLLGYNEFVEGVWNLTKLAEQATYQLPNIS